MLDRPTVLLFDIDGTLITTGGAGRRAVANAIEAWGEERGIAFGPEAWRFSFGGMTDRAIVRKGLTAAGFAPTEADIDDLLDRYLAALAAEVTRSATNAYRIHPGVHDVLDAVAGRDGVAVGLGTGNVERGARIKLEHVGLSHRFAFGGFGCDAEERPSLLRAGAARGAARLGVPIEAARVVVIGDTWRDVEAAHAIGAECVAVATGQESLESLRARGPRWAFPDLRADGLLAALLGAGRPGSPSDGATFEPA